MNSRVNSAAARDIEYHIHGYTNLKKHQVIGPHVIQDGSGVFVTDDNGKSYIEGVAGLWCTSLGFSETRLIDAAIKEMKRLPYYHGFGGKVPDVTIDLAEKLIQIAPVPMSKVLFANSGSEANDLAVKLIWYYHNAIGKPEKKKIISRIKGYHGVTVCAASLTGLPHLHNSFDLPIDKILHTSCPHFYRFGKDGETENEFVTRCVEELEDLIQREGPETIAAFFAEPVMGAGGVLIPPKKYFSKIQPILKKYDILFVADEVICGFGRTGNMWGSETFELTPDMISCAKALSSAYLPISALFINEKIYESISKQSDEIGIFGHGSTYAGHPVAAAVALETLRIYESESIVEQVRMKSSQFARRLSEFSNYDFVGEVRSIGLIGAVELVADKKSKKSFDPKSGVGLFCQNQALSNGLIVRAIGDNIGFCPPLIISEKELDQLFDIFTKSLKETQNWISNSISI